MATFLVTFIALLLFIAFMAVGVIMKRAPLKGSCGGVSKLDGIDCACQMGPSGKRNCDGNFRPLPSMDDDANDTSLAYKA
ncbi:(Na+)-NQR maturation NqrM [bacterium]|nr:(Na+)-NQR maturation NqrM [bacterium]